MLDKAPVVAGLITGQKASGRNVYDSDARSALVRLCLEPGVSISRTALVNGINANQLRRWINEYKFDPVRFDRRLSGGAVAKGRKANSQPALMLPVDLTNMPAIPVLPASQAPGLISPRMVDVELARGRVRLHGVDAAMLATVFNLLNAD